MITGMSTINMALLPTLLAASSTPPNGTEVPTQSLPPAGKLPTKNMSSTIAPVVRLHSEPPIIVVKQDADLVAHAAALLTALPDSIDKLADIFVEAQAPALDFNKRRLLETRISALQSRVRTLGYHQKVLDNSGTRDGDAFRESLRLVTLIMKQLSVTHLRSDARSQVRTLAIMAADVLAPEMIEMIEPDFVYRLRNKFNSY